MRSVEALAAEASGTDCPGTVSSGPAGARGSIDANDNTNLNTNSNVNTSTNPSSSTDQPSASPRLGDDNDKKTGLDRADEAAGSHGQHGRDNARDKQQR